MTETAAGLPAEAASYVQSWAESLAQVLGQIGGSPLPCTVLGQAPTELAPPGDGDLWIVCVCSGGLRGEMSLRLPAAATLRLAQIFMSEPPDPAGITPEHREAAVELLRQVAGLVASMFKAKWGEVQLRVDSSAAAPSWPPASTAWLRAGDDPAASLLEISFSAALQAGLRTERAEIATPTAPLAAPLSSSTEENRVKLDLLMDVELAVTLRFGSRRLLLREVLDLNPGAVVDLDRQVEEPVDVLLDGLLVARGEVVVMNGNYGLRVTEVTPANP